MKIKLLIIISFLYSIPAFSQKRWAIDGAISTTNLIRPDQFTSRFNVLGYKAGISFLQQASPKLEVGASLLYSQYGQKYYHRLIQGPGDTIKINYINRVNYLEFKPFVHYYFFEFKKVKTFINIGIKAGYLLSAKFKFNYEPSKEYQSANDIYSYYKWNYAGEAGLGVKALLNQNQSLYLLVTYDLGFNNINKPDLLSSQPYYGYRVKSLNLNLIIPIF